MYTTETEKKFLDNLGSYRPDRNSLPHRKLMSKYYKASKKRVYWGSIDGEEIRDYIRKSMGWVK